jgi:hypothetical protein
VSKLRWTAEEAIEIYAGYEDLESLRQPSVPFKDWAKFVLSRKVMQALYSKVIQQHLKLVDYGSTPGHSLGFILLDTLRATKSDLYVVDSDPTALDALLSNFPFDAHCSNVLHTL